MVFDLGRAMRKKEEFETARLIDFAFRLRARTARLLAEELGLDAEEVVGRIVTQDHASMLAALAAQVGCGEGALVRRWQALEAAARQALIAERGDPTPYRLG